MEVSQSYGHKVLQRRFSAKMKQNLTSSTILSAFLAYPFIGLWAFSAWTERSILFVNCPGHWEHLKKNSVNISNLFVVVEWFIFTRQELDGVSHIGSEP